MKNRFPGTCGCGKKVARQRGELALVNDVFIVRCSVCVTGNVEAVAPVKSARKSGGKARVFRRSSAPSARRAGRKSVRGRRVKRAYVATPWTTAPVTPPEVLFSPLAYGAEVLVMGEATQCTPEYARFLKAGQAAAKSGKLDLELELLVTLAEMRDLGHLASHQTSDAFRLAA